MINNNTVLDPAVEQMIQEVATQMAEIAMENLPYPSKGLISPSSQQKKLELESEKDLKIFIDRISQGFKQIEEKIKVIQDEDVKLELTVFSQKSVQLETQALKSMLYPSSPTELKEQMGVSEEALKAIYRIGAETYNHNEYSEAASLFTILALLDASRRDYWLALGNAEYFCQRYYPALIAYAIAAQVDPRDPQCHFLSAHCYQSLKEYDNALNALEIALFIINNNPDLTPLVEKAEGHRQYILQLAGKG